ncbi:hypothetical protein GCM10027074_28350 [Streptomyces deserti]
MTELSEAERTYLKSQRLGRLATVDPKGQPQANPVGFFPQDDGTILIGGYALGRTKKWRNLQKNPKASLVVDDVVSVRPWKVRGIEIRGEAELLTGPHDLGPHFSEELIRIHPRWIHSWGLDGTSEGDVRGGRPRGRLEDALVPEQVDLPLQSARVPGQ